MSSLGSTPRCAFDGFLAGSAHPIPDDPAARAVKCRPLGGGIPCNHLICTSCNVDVRSASHLRLSEAWKPSELYDHPWWDGLPGTEHSFHLRTYACRCSIKQVRDVECAVNWEPEPGDPAYPPWRCGGHPVRTYPFTLSDVVIDGATLWDELIAGALDEQLPPNRESGSPERWLLMLYEALEGHPDQAVLGEKLQGLVWDSGERARYIGYMFRFLYPDASDAKDTLAAIQSTLPTLKVRWGRHHVSLPNVVGALYLRGEHDRTRQVMQSIYTTPGERPKLASTYSRAEILGADWTATNLHHIEAAHPGTWKNVIDELAATDQALALVGCRRLMEQGEARTQEVMTYVRARYRNYRWATVVLEPDDAPDWAR